MSASRLGGRQGPACTPPGEVCSRGETEMLSGRGVEWVSQAMAEPTRDAHVAGECDPHLVPQYWQHQQDRLSFP